MQIHIARHARQRMRLYQISSEAVEQVVLKGQQSEGPGGMRSELEIGGRPLPVIWVPEGDDRVVKTVFPVRRRKRG